MTEHRFDDRSMETIMGRLLQVGVALPSLVVALGGLLYVRSHAHNTINYSAFVRRPVDLHHLGGLVPAVFHGNATAIIETGVLFLIATPIARVVFAAIAFAEERDRLYLAISLFVLAVLMFGLLHGA
jgi:uncharacterized membrane protein